MPRFARRILDLQLPTSGFALAHWHRYLQHPISEVGLSFLCVHPLRQGKLTIEIPVGALRAIETFALSFLIPGRSARTTSFRSCSNISTWGLHIDIWWKRLGVV